MIVLKISTLLIIIAISLIGGYITGKCFSIAKFFKNKKDEKSPNRRVKHDEN
jgi:hypothetical protein